MTKPVPARPAPRLFGLAGRSGSGKTTLLVSLLPELRRRGFTVSTIKHAHHGFDLDRPGKDSYRHREAGAAEVMLVSEQRWALLHEVAASAPPDFAELAAHMAPVDLLLIEGFASHPHPKLEIHRPSLGQPLLWRPGGTIVAVASDEPLSQAGAPRLDLADIAAIADCVLRHAAPARSELT